MSDKDPAAGNSQQLSSDILEDQFGPVGVEVLRHQDGQRIIRSRRLSDDATLELSWVTFRPEGQAAFAEISQDMARGQSMGKAFRDRGLAFRRRTAGTYSYELPPALAQRFGGDGPATVVLVSIEGGLDNIPFADILEIYGPVVRWPDPASPITPQIAAQIRAFMEEIASLPPQDHSS